MKDERKGLPLRRLLALIRLPLALIVAHTSHWAASTRRIDSIWRGTESPTMEQSKPQRSCATRPSRLLDCAHLHLWSTPKDTILRAVWNRGLHYDSEMNWS